MQATNSWIGLIALCLAVVAAPAAGQATVRHYLSGRDVDSAVDWEFFCTEGRQSKVWTTLPVPSCWDVKGFGTLSFYKDNDKAPVEQGQYRHTFDVPAAWADRRVFLVFDGVMTDTDARVNGRPAGPTHQGGFYQFKYDVTGLLKAGENLLEVDVKKKSDNDSINKAERTADYWLFGGIFRPVYLEVVPRQFIERVAIDAQADGTFNADVVTPANEDADGVRVDVLDADGRTVASANASPGAAPGTALSVQVPGIRQWTAETPALYTARFRLTRGDQVLHEITKRFGFRTIEIRRGDGIYVNGRRVMFKGVNRHAAWPDSGRTLSPRIDAADIDLIKSMNMNAVRMSHYPPDESFLDLCDERGLYVIDEMAGWQKPYDTPTAIRLAGETVRRDVNHPSVLFWANGNEGGWNKNADAEFAKWDPQRRPVIHPWALHDRLNTKHYSKYEDLKTLLAGRDVVMPTEFLHGLYDGGAGAGLRDYWDLMLASPVSAGGFFWVFADEGIRRPDSGRIDVAGNAGPDGIVGPYREKEGSFFTIRQIWSPVVLPRDLPGHFAGRLPVTNAYDFTSLDATRFEWSLLKWNGPADATAGHRVVASGQASVAGVMPGAKGELQLGLPADWSSADALCVSATNAAGRAVIEHVYPLDAARSYLPPEAVAGEPSADAEAGTLVAGDVEMRVEPGTGRVLSVRRGGRSIAFSGGPRLAHAVPAGTAADASTAVLKDVQWAAGRDGWFRLTGAIDARGPCDFLGVTFDLPADTVRMVRWLGVGPYPVYQNRLDGGTTGVWEKAYNTTVTGASEWVYPEFKGYHAPVRWATVTGTQGVVRVVPQTKGLYLHLLRPDLPPANLVKYAACAYPDGSLSLLHAIPAIGSKLSPAAGTGPQGRPFQADGTYPVEAWFRFE